GVGGRGGGVGADVPVVGPVLGHAAAGCDLLDGDHGQVVPVGEGAQGGGTHHGAVVVDQLDQCPCSGLAGQGHQVHAGLGVASSLEHSGGPGAQREDVPGPVGGRGAGGGAGQQSQGQGASGCADPRAHADGRIDADGEGGALGVGVGSDHLGQLQLLEPVPGQGHADDAAGVTHGEGQQLLGRGDSREDQVALVLTVLVVDHDHRLSGGEGVQGSIEGVEMNGVHRCICAWAESSVSVCFSRYLAST